MESLAALAGNTIVVAATTDAWDAARGRFTRLLGGGDREQEQRAGRWLEESRQQLTGAEGVELERARAELAQRWGMRLADLLEEDPGAEAELRAVVDEIRAMLPASAVSAAGHSVSAGRDVTVRADHGGVAAAVIHGTVAPGPVDHGPSDDLSGAGFARPGGVFADRGALAIGQVIYQRARAAGPPMRLAPRLDYLAGRDELLAQVHARLTADAPGSRTVVLCGLGGAGKTSVAVEYAYQHMAEIGAAWQFDCEDRAVLEDGFGELAAQLGVRDLLATRDWVATVHGVLAQYPAEWLLIFDNAEDPAALRAFLPPAGPGRVLVTSRNAHWSPGQVVDVPVLSTDVAAIFLVRRTGDPDEQAAAELAEELGGLPLALEQAAAYMRATGTAIAGYLALFWQRRSDLLARGEAHGHPATVQATLGLALARLDADAPAASGLLRLLAFLAPEPTPLDSLLQPGPELAGQPGQEMAPLLADPLTVKDAIAALRKYSLVTPAGNGRVSAHRLVQAVTADQMPAELASQWRQAAATLIEAALPADSRQPRTWPVFGQLRPHADKALAPGSSGIERIASYLGHSGSYAAARDLQREVLQAREQILGPEHPDTLLARRNLAHWTGQAGDAAGAQEQDEALLPVIEQVLGAEHPDAIAVRAAIALWTRKARRRRDHGRGRPDIPAAAGTPGRAWTAKGPARAAAQYAELLPLSRQVLGADHLSTLAIRAGLAWSTGEAQDTVMARDQFAALLPDVKRILGPDDPLTLDVRAGLARWTGSARGGGDAAGARDQFVDLLPVFERILGPEHPDTLYIRHSVARWTGQAGDPATARDQYAELLSVRERILGPDHPDTAVARKNLDHWTENADSGADQLP